MTTYERLIQDYALTIAQYGTTRLTESEKKP